MVGKRKDFIVVLAIVSLAASILIYRFWSDKNDRYMISGDETQSIQEIIDESQDDEDMMLMEEDDETIVVYISGEVENPGVYEVDSKTRLYEVVEEAGGLTIEADREKINLAQKLKDEGHYSIRKMGEDMGDGDDQEPEAEARDGRLDINRASGEELKTLPGIGEKTAQKIIDYRERVKSFKSIGDIQNVSGIGEKKYDQIKDLICVN